MSTQISPHLVNALYTQSRIPHFRGNPLVEALPPSMTDDSLIDSLTLLPDFHPEQREWTTSERFMMIESLQNFMLPMQNQIQLCRALDGMLRSGYVGRAPRTPGHAEIAQTLYRMQVEGKGFSQMADSRTPQISTALIGISGMGKSTTVERWCAHLPRVIYHPEYNLHQIPFLHVEMPSDGKSTNGLAYEILLQLDKLVPSMSYFERYASDGRKSADTLMKIVARLMNIHLVGILFCDEINNLANANKGAATVMTEVVTMSNILKAPVVFIGTNKASKVLSMDLRSARRASGHGITPWDRLHAGTAANPSEWDAFLSVLWQFQWLKNPVSLDPIFCKYMYECSQGVIDIAIKLFCCAQARAMVDGTEQLTPELLLAVFDGDFKLMHPMLKALQTNNLDLLVQYEDITPLNLHEYLEAANRKLALRKSPLFSVKSNDQTFEPRLSAGLSVMGFDSDASQAVASAIAKSDTPIDLAQGVKRAVAELSAIKPVRRTKTAKNEPALSAERYDARPLDYRRAIAHASAKGTGTLEQLKCLNMAPTLENVLGL